MRSPEKPIDTRLLSRAVIPIVITWSLIPVAFGIPMLDSTRAPYIDLTGPFAQITYWFSRSGGRYGIPFVAVCIATLLVTREGFTLSKRWREFVAVILAVVVFGGGGSVLNEYFLKVQLKVPRPNVVLLAGEHGTGPLRMTATEFYESGDRAVRAEELDEALSETVTVVALSSTIRAYWIETTGYSFPSGHAFSAMFIAAFFVACASTCVTERRLLIFFLLLPWGLAVSYSRLILRVHTPLDVTVGGAIGCIVGVLACLGTRMVIRRFPQA